MVKLDAVINTWVRNRALEHERNLQKADTIQTTIETNEEVCLAVFSALPGFDAAGALAKFGGDTESFASILNSYVKNTPPLLNELRSVSEDTLPNYAILVHGIKGSSRSICAEEIGRDAEALELAAKKGNLGFVRTNNACFLEKTTGFIEALRSALDDFVRADRETRERRPVPDPGLLSVLAAAAVTFDIDTAEETLSKLEAFDYEKDGDLVEWLREQLDIGGFANITDRLTERKQQAV
jgi:HPt (histidine-containing phosphotransfer) domain-containing protein